MARYKNLTDTFLNYIPYRGAGPALNDTVGGQVNMIFDNLPSTLPFIKQKLRIPIVVAAPERLAALPDVPTFKAVGLEPVNCMAFYGMVGPKGLPKDVVDKIAAGVKKSLLDLVIRKRIEATDSLVIGNTPEQFAVQMKTEYEVCKKVVETAKLKLEQIFSSLKVVQFLLQLA
jgi:tripartite-type tricarboxylate transporter receptor subunit TctC